MSHRRRFLNLVTRNWTTGVYSLRRVDLHSRHNNLFYPTPAAAHDPSALLSNGGVDGRPREVALKKVPRIHLPPAPAQCFQQCHVNDSSASRRRMACVALSESQTVFLNLEYRSRRAFLYDAGGRRVVTLPDLDASMYDPICHSVTDAGADGGEHDTVYVMSRSLRHGEPHIDGLGLEPPEGWYIDGGCRLVSLGSGKFCLVQFFETREEACSRCLHEEVEDKFAV